MKVRIGIVGIGRFSDDFIKLFNQHPDVEEVAVADIIPQRVQECMKKYHLKRGYDSFEDMLKNGKDLNCIAIFTQRHLHGHMAVEAMEAGKHVYSAVPIACEIEDIQKVIETAKRSRHIYMMGETCYYYPCAIYCRNQYQKNEFGKFVYGEAQYYHDICEMYGAFQHSGGENWRRVAGIPPMFYPTHSMSMILSCIDQHAVKVSCMGLRDNHEDHIYGEGKNDWDNPFSNETAMLQLSGGGVARINEFRRVGINKPSSYITAFYGEKGAYECSITQHSFQRGVASGEKPSVTYLDELINTERYVQDKHRGSIDYTRDPISIRYIEGFAPIHDRSRLPKAFRDVPPFAHYNSHPFLVDDFVRAVMTGKLPPNNAWDSARYMIPGLIAHESALKGGVLTDVPDFGDAPADWERLTYEMPDYYEE